MIVNKSKKAILSLILSLIMPLSSCGIKSSNQTQDAPSSIEINIESEPDFDATYQIKEQRKLALDYFHSYLDSIYIEYPLIDHYITDEEIDEIIASSNEPTRCLKTYSKDVDEIINAIKSNSDAFLKKDSSFNQAFVSDTNTKTKANEIFERALREALSIMMNESGNLNEDIHKMHELSIVFGDGSRAYDADYREGTVIKSEVTSLVLGFYDPSMNLMVIDPDALVQACEWWIDIEVSDISYEMMLATLMHELNHVRQSVCSCRLEQNAGIVDSLRYGNNILSSLTESSAESELYNLDKYPYDFARDANAYSYMDERNGEAIILMMALFNENASLADYYDAIFDTDYQKLHNFLNLTSKEDIRRFYKILYSIDGILLRNNLVIDAYSEEERDTKTLFDFRSDLGYDYLIDIYRFILNRMSTYTYNHEDFSLEDNLVLLEIIQDVLCSTFFTVGEDSVESYQRFKDNLTNMSYAYRTFLSDVYSVSMESLDGIDENTFYYEVALNNGVNYDLNYSKYNKRVDSLLKRFPILKAIVKNREYFISNYERITGDYEDFSLSLPF